jgi:hypothetical protein
MKPSLAARASGVSFAAAVGAGVVGVGGVAVGAGVAGVGAGAGFGGVGAGTGAVSFAGAASGAFDFSFSPHAPRLNATAGTNNQFALSFITSAN